MGNVGRGTVLGECRAWRRNPPSKRVALHIYSASAHWGSDDSDSRRISSNGWLGEAWAEAVSAR